MWNCKAHQNIPKTLFLLPIEVSLNYLSFSALENCRKTWNIINKLNGIIDDSVFDLNRTIFFIWWWWKNDLRIRQRRNLFSTKSLVGWNSNMDSLSASVSGSFFRNLLFSILQIVTIWEPSLSCRWLTLISNLPYFPIWSPRSSYIMIVCLSPSFSGVHFMNSLGMETSFAIARPSYR